MREFIQIIENTQSLPAELVKYMTGYCLDFALAFLSLLSANAQK